MVSVTSAMPVGLREAVPLKITSAMCAPRKDLADCSPSTQLMASLTFDFPHPLGPTTAAIPPPVKLIGVRSQNDLNPTISTFFSLSKAESSPRWNIVAPGRGRSKGKILHIEDFSPKTLYIGVRMPGQCSPKYS